MRKYEVYVDPKGEWRWVFFGANGEKIADSGDGYKNKQDCRHSIRLVMFSYDAPVYER